jgi:hypothetical protein
MAKRIHAVKWRSFIKATMKAGVNTTLAAVTTLGIVQAELPPSSGIRRSFVRNVV